jgi:hypothetical protein
VLLNFSIIVSWDLNDFFGKLCSIFNKFSIIGQNIMKPNPCIATHQTLSNGSKSMARGAMVWEIST